MAPVLQAEYVAEERRGGACGRGGTHPVGLSESPMRFQPNHQFTLAPIKRKADGGEAMKGTWATEKGSRAGVVIKAGTQGHKLSRVCCVTKNLRRRF